MSYPITSEMVQQLREKTGEGMMACKKALVYTEGDMDEAVDHLRRAGTLNARCVTTSMGRTPR